MRSEKKTHLQKMKRQGGGKRDYGIIEKLKHIKGLPQRYNAILDLTINEETHWYIKQWLKGYPPVHGQGK